MKPVKPVDPMAAHRVVALRNPRLAWMKDMTVRDGMAISTDLDITSVTPTDMPDGMYRVVGPLFELYPGGAGRTPEEEDPHIIPPIENPCEPVDLAFHREAFQVALNFVDEKEAARRPKIGCVCLRIKHIPGFEAEQGMKMTIMATDGIACSHFVTASPAGIPEGDYIIPVKAIRALLLDKTSSILRVFVGDAKNDKDTHFISLATQQIRVVARLISGQYYAMETIVPREVSRVIWIDGAKFAQTMKDLKPYLPHTRDVTFEFDLNDRSVVILTAENAGEQLHKSITLDVIEKSGGPCRSDKLFIIQPFRRNEGDPDSVWDFDHLRLSNIAKSNSRLDLFMGFQETADLMHPQPVVFSGYPLTDGGDTE